MCTGSNKNWAGKNYGLSTKTKGVLNHCDSIIPYPNGNQIKPIAW